MQWSNHRVMEWLRAVDLAEYAPNLRGSGVHGGLIVSTAHFEIFCQSLPVILVSHTAERAKAVDAICCQYLFSKILEPRFSSETLALLLNIPPQKTLLRRHLATAFSALVGTQAAQEKREYANATGHVPLTTTAKVKVRVES